MELKALLIRVKVHMKDFETSNCIIYDLLRLCQHLIFLDSWKLLSSHNLSSCFHLSGQKFSPTTGSPDVPLF